MASDMTIEEMETTIRKLQQEIEDLKEEIERTPEDEYTRIEDLENSIDILTHTVNDIMTTYGARFTCQALLEHLNVTASEYDEHDVIQHENYVEQKTEYETAKKALADARPGVAIKYYMLARTVRDSIESKKALVETHTTLRDETSLTLETREEIFRYNYQEFPEGAYYHKDLWQAELEKITVKAEGVAVGAGAGA